MKPSYLYIRICSLLLIVALITSCGGQEKSPTDRQTDHSDSQTEKSSNGKKITGDLLSNLFDQFDPQIAEYIRHIFEDKEGNLWFGTNDKGVAYYDGESIAYFSQEEGFGGRQITGITEDLQKNLWFATDRGVVKYDWSLTEKGEKRFINYNDEKDFGGQRFWSIFADSKGNVWGGSASQIFRFQPTGQAGEGGNWSTFDLPYTEKAENGGFITVRTSWSITEDKDGNIWFATNGLGAFKYDGKSFTQYTQKDGLTDDSVDPILADSKGNIWLGTRQGGLSRYDGQTFTNYTEENSIGNNEVCEIYEDKAGNIWFSSEGYGVYRYTVSPITGQESLTNFFLKEGLKVKAVQTIFEDRAGRLWVGGGGGLYRYDPAIAGFINVRKHGPWD